MNKLLTFICICLLFSSSFSDSFSDPSDDDDVVEEFKDTFPILFIILTALNFILNFVCIFQTIRRGKFNKDAKYVFILNYIILKTIHGGFRCVSLLSSSKLIGAHLYISPSPSICKLTYFGTFFFEFGEALLLSLVWVVLFSERNMLGFQSLYDDLKGNSTRNIRRIFLIVYYVLAFFFFGTLASFSKDYDDYYPFLRTKSCVLDGSPAAIIALGFMLVFCPTLFSLAQYSIVFWKVFGGARDPIKSELTSTSRGFLSFIKINCILKVLEFFFLDIQSSQGMFFKSLMTEVFRTLGLVVAFVSAVLYLYYESLIPFMNTSQEDSMQISFAPQNSIVNEPADESGNIEPIAPYEYSPGFKSQRIN